MLPLLALLLTLPACGGADRSDVGPESRTITLAAASSLRHVLPLLVDDWRTQRPEVRLQISYGGSGTLRQQVEAGAPIDAVIFAAPEPVDRLIERGRVTAGSRRVLATNDLVLVAPAASSNAWTFATLTDLPADERLAMGQPDTVPAGRYAEQALRDLGSWDALADRRVTGGDVATVLTWARRGEAAAAIVYGTEARGVDAVRVLDRADWAGAPRPQVVAGVVVDGDPAAADFLAYVAGPEAALRWVDAGFGAP